MADEVLLHGVSGHHRPHQRPRPHQHRLRRREDGHEQRRLGHHGDRYRLGRRARRQRGPSRHHEPASRGLDRGRAGNPAQHRRRQRPHLVRGERGRGHHPRRRPSRRQHHLRQCHRRRPRRHGEGDGHRGRLRPLRARRASDGSEREAALGGAARGGGPSPHADATGTAGEDDPLLRATALRVAATSSTSAATTISTSTTTSTSPPSSARRVHVAGTPAVVVLSGARDGDVGLRSGDPVGLVEARRQAPRARAAGVSCVSATATASSFSAPQEPCEGREADALVSTLPGAPLAVFSADCALIGLASPQGSGRRPCTPAGVACSQA